MSQSMESVLNEILNDESLSKMFKDPVSFARAIMDIDPRPYQKLMLRCKNNQRVVRCGRRAGKTAAMIMHILWYAYTNPESKQLVVAPVGTQVDEIFIELRKFIRGNQLLESSIKRDVKDPQTLVLSNGAVIKGLSAGTSSARGAKSIRGQGADWVYLDEADYLSEDDINSIMGIMLEDMGNIGIWSASTPSGAKEIYYDWCNNASTTYTVNNYKDLEYVKRENDNGNGWTEFHFPAMCSPKWNADVEAEFRSMFTENGYVREVLAEFGEKQASVYRNDHIQQAYKEYEYAYEDMVSRSPLPRNYRIMGIDWDKHGANTQIVISEFISDIDKIAVVHRTEIPQHEYAYTKAVNQAVSIFRDWDCDYVFADRGHGELQVELLKSKLGKERVIGCAFNKSVDITDPADKKTKKKELKHFMVTQTQILLEMNQLVFPKDDFSLRKQFEEYEVVRYTSGGKPIYSDVNEHIHDAVTLTIYGFNEKFPDITKILESIRYSRTVKFLNKNVQSIKDQSKIFGDSFNKKKKDNELDDEPEYVKRMKSIEYGRKRTKGYRSWGNRGSYNSGPPKKRAF